MLFSKRLSADFTNAIRSRGRHYFEYDKVRITGYSDNSVAAIAYGTMEYEVSLDFVDGSTLSVDCDCPSFYSGDNCKHIWATILCVEEASHLSIYGDSNKTIYVVTEEDAFAEQSLDGDISAEYDLEQLDYQDEIRARKLSTKGKPWRNLLDQLFHSKPGKMIDPYVAEQQIVYFVDVIRTTTTGTMLISVGMQEKKKNGDWGVIRSLKTDYMFNGALPTKQDSTIVGILMGAQLEKHRTQYPFSLSHGTSDMDYLVPRDMQEKILRLVTDTGRGRIKKNRNAKDFPVLSWDNEGSWEFGMQLARIDKPKKCSL